MTTVRDYVDQIDSGEYDPDEIEANSDMDNPLADYWATLALGLASAVKAESIQVRVGYDAPDSDEVPAPRRVQELTLPSWCSGDAATGAALYLFGYAGAVKALHITAEVLG